MGVAVAGVAPGNAPHAPAGATVVPAALGVGVGVPEAEGGVCTNGLAITGGWVCALRRDSGALVWGGSWEGVRAEGSGADSEGKTRRNKKRDLLGLRFEKNKKQKTEGKERECKCAGRDLMTQHVAW